MSNQIQVFPKETTDYIAEQFKDYYRRKKKSRLSYRDAKMLIDHVSGPVPGPGGMSAQDYSKPRISGGGAARPGDSDIEAMMKNYEPGEWDAVFDELLHRLQWNWETEMFVKLTYRDKLSEPTACDEMGISRSKYFTVRKSVLSQAGVLAVQKGVLDPWKY